MGGGGGDDIRDKCWLHVLKANNLLEATLATHYHTQYHLHPFYFVFKFNVWVAKQLPHTHIHTGSNVWQCDCGRGGVLFESMGQVLSPHQRLGDSPGTPTAGHCRLLPEKQGER